MKRALALLTLSFLLAGCGKHLTDAEIGRKAVGVWIFQRGADKTEIRSDGSFSEESGTNAYSGTWRVEGGYATVLITNMPGHAPGEFGHPTRYKVISIDDHQMTIVLEGTTNSTTLTRQ